jgi:FkbM family methyltransferase
MKLSDGVFFFEALISRLYQLLCAAGDVCVDVGANKGTHTFGMAKVVGAGGLVHAYEPLPRMAKIVADGAASRGFPVSVHQVAVSNYNGRAQFNHIRNYTGASSLFVRDHGSLVVEREVIEVAVTTLDSELAGVLDRWRFMKMDIEAGEYHALHGATGIIPKFRPFVVMECGFEKAARIAKYTAQDWFAAWGVLGYRPYDLYGFAITPQRWTERYKPYNVIAVAAGSDDERFVTGPWRPQVDLLASRMRAGLKWSDMVFDGKVSLAD